MITTAEDPRNSNRVIRIAIAGSVLVHAMVLLVALLANAELSRLLAQVAPHPAATPPPQDEIVTISSAVRIEPRPKPVAAAPVHRSRQSPRQVAVVPHPVTVTRPEYQTPAVLKHELAKQSPHAPLEPQKTTTAPPRPQQLASFQQPTHYSMPQRARPQLSQEQLSKFERDFAKTIAQSRSAVNPLKVDPNPAAAPKRYRIQLAGLFGRLRHGEGIYFPIRGWRSGGLDYYYVNYEFVWADGTYERGSVPWPIHFAPNVDPFVSADIGMLQRTPLPPPAPGFVPPGDLGKALRPYFPSLQFEDE
jgi:hypothetical protein